MKANIEKMTCYNYNYSLSAFNYYLQKLFKANASLSY